MGDRGQLQADTQRQRAGRSSSSSMGAIALLLLLCMRLALATGAPLPFPPRAATAPYATLPPSLLLGRPSPAHWINVQGPPSLTGAMATQPATIGTHPPVNGTINGVAVWSAELMVPHVLDDPRACMGVNQTMRRTNELNETFTGKIMLLRRGTCAFGLKAEAAEAAGAAGVLLQGCSPDPPSLCDPGLVLITGTQTINIPLIYVQSPDGFLLHDHLVSRMAQRVRWLDPVAAAAAVSAGEAELEPITLDIPSTGSMDPAERTALVSLISATSMRQATQLVFGGSRPWNVESLSDPALDPCLDRVAGLWCEDGHAVEINLQEVLMTGAFPPQLGQLMQLRVIDLSINRLSGPVPVELCSLTHLISLALQQQNSGNLDGFTSLPDCISTSLTRLETLTIGNNALTSLPSLTALTRMTQADFARNAIVGVLDTDFGGMAQLHIVKGSFNKLTALPTGFRAHPSLSVLELANNLMAAPLPSDAFDGCTSLTTLDLSSNELSGALPSLDGCGQLQTLWLSSNRFASTIPTVWSVNLPELRSFKAAWNSIVSPIGTFGELVYLHTIDLSHNLLTAFTGIALQEEDVGALLSGASSPALANLDLSHNRIRGAWAAGWLNLAVSLSVISLAHNALTELPYDLFLNPFASLDVSHNNISVWGETNAPGPNFLYLNLLNNPYLAVERLPQWVVVGDQMFTNAGDSFACPALSSTTSVLMKFLVDSAFSHYAGCACNKGTFGRPPLCHSVPLTATLLPDGSYSSAEVGSEFATVVGQAGSLANVTGDGGALERSFSDGWYGNARLTLGLATSWVLDLRTLPNSTLPVRHMVVRLHVSRALFSSETDVLTVYEGDGSLSGARVAQLRGTDAMPPASSEHTRSAEYQTRYARQLAALGPQSVLEVLVLTPLATVSFSSRAESGTRFFATYSFATECPSEHFLVTTTQRCVPCYASEGTFFDVAQQRCRPNLVEYRVSDGIRAAVWATAAAAFVAVMMCTVMVVARWDSPIIRAASRSFLLLLLAFLAMWPLGALLYATTPVAGTATGELVCHARVWLSAFPLSGVLAVLLAKTNRVDTIFGSSKLVLRKVTDTDLLGTVTALLSGVSVLLVVFSAMQMAQPDLSEGSGAHLNQLLRSCTNSSAYTPWLGVLLAYIFVLCLCAAFLAWRTRDLPSRFNESGHIMNALLVLLFFGAIIVPLGALIQDNPEAAVLIHGVGQTLLCMLLTAVIFGPKAYLLMVTPPLDQNSALGGTVLGGGAGGNHASAIDSEALPTGHGIGSPSVTKLQPPTQGPSKPGGGRNSTREAAYLPGQAESKRSSPQMAWRAPPGSPSLLPQPRPKAGPSSPALAKAPRLLSAHTSSANAATTAPPSAPASHFLITADDDIASPSGGIGAPAAATAAGIVGSFDASRRGSSRLRVPQLPPQPPPVLVHVHTQDATRPVVPVPALELTGVLRGRPTGAAGESAPLPAPQDDGVVESFRPSPQSTPPSGLIQTPKPQQQHPASSSTDRAQTGDVTATATADADANPPTHLLPSPSSTDAASTAQPPAATHA